MNSSIVNFSYNGSPISFDKGETVMINATEMAKPFGKRPVDWLQNQQSKDFIEALSEVRKSTLADLVKVAKGGNNAGTWMHEDVALEFARWLSPAFAIWCNDRIKEMLTSGQTSISKLSRKELAQMVIEAEEENERLQLEVKKRDEQIAEDAPRVLFSKAVETAKRSCLIAELAKILQQNGVSIGQNRLFRWMRENGYLCSKGQYYNQPTQKAMQLGLFEIKKTTINKPDGSVLVSTTTKCSGKGQVYFVNKFLNEPIRG